MINRFILFLLGSILVSPLYSQMEIDGETLFGNEWINYDQTYIKVTVNEDGVYKLDKTALENMGYPIDAITLSKIQIYHLGKEVSIYTSTEEIASTNDYILFWGERNRGNIDKFVYADHDQMMNQDVSFFTDESSYFLTWSAENSTSHLINTNYNLDNVDTPQPYFMANSRQNYYNNWIKNYTKSGSTYLNFSHFDLGEGWCKIYNNQVSETIDLPYLYTATSVGGHFETTAVTLAYQETHMQELKINDIPVDTVTYTGYQAIKFSEDLAPSDLLPSFTYNLNQINNEVGISHTQLLIYSEVTYPHTFNMGGESTVKFDYPKSEDDLYFEFENFTIDGQIPVLFDITNNKYYQLTVDGNILKVVVAPSNFNHSFILVNPNAYKDIIRSESKTFTNYAEITDINYVIITHAHLNNSDNGTNWIQEYGNYRSSIAGGSYFTQIINIDELYDQFAYGIHYHPISIRNFSHYIVNSWQNIQGYFLMGKGTPYLNSKNISPVEEVSINALVPSWGHPQSDALLFASNESHAMIAPLGRLAADTPDKVRIYLDKVMAFEAQQNAPQTIEGKAWMKRFIHLGGGKSTSEQTNFKNYLNSIKDIVESNPLGGEVFSYFKTSSDPISVSPREKITQLFNEGVTALTFFGHSSPDVFDFSINDAPFYDNEGKYPFIFSLGCSAGNVFTANEGISERFLFEEKKGSIGFYASSHFAYPGALQSFHKRFFERLNSNFYNESIGKIMQENNVHFESNTGNQILYLKEQLLLHADPVLKLNTHNGPDYITNRKSFNTLPALLNTRQDSFVVNFEIYNIGSANLDSINVKIEQKTPAGIVHLLTDYRIPTPLNKINQEIKVPLVSEDALGQNRIIITIDSNDEIEEIPTISAESNNVLTDINGLLGMPVFVIDDSANPNWPQNYSIVNGEQITLRATTSNPFSLENKYILQIDTTELFNSPNLLENEITQIGGVISWDLNIDWQDNQVYYWRSTVDSTETIGYNWKNASFLYLDNVPSGWNQSHYFQYKKDALQTIVLDTMSREFNYVKDVQNLEVKVGHFWEHSTYATLNNLQVQQALGGLPFNTLWVTVLGGVDLEKWINPPGGIYGAVNTSTTESHSVFAYRMNTEEQRSNLINFLENIVTDGSYVLINSATQPSHDLGISGWALDSVNTSTNIYQVFESNGASLVRNFQTEEFKPYSFLYKKNDSNFTPVEYYSDYHEFNVDLSVYWHEGRITSTKIGPAKSWENIIWNLENYDSETDHISLTVTGIREDQTEEVLMTNLQDFNIDIQNIDAQIYPYIRMDYYNLDTAMTTLPNLDFWRVHFLEQPDLAIAQNEFFSWPKDTFEQGENINLELGVQNISTVDMDSCKISYFFVDAQNQIQELQESIPALSAGEIHNSNLDFSSQNLGGNINLNIVVNNDDSPKESIRLNNYALLNLFVNSDIINPLLDVTFDGKHIINGDIVSTQPEIIITLDDDNQYLLLNDTSNIQVSVKYPLGNEFIEIPTNHPDLEFLPATNNADNIAQMIYSPTFVEDGIYYLKVQGLDQSGNVSGDFSFDISFEIITQSSISSLLNYPNPFITSTQFVYTLTGSPEDIPDDYYIQILSVSGKIVKTITAIELGELKIGTNKTEYAWDGTDDYGDRLANGVYLYRFSIKNNGEEKTEHFDSSVDKFFKNGFGKLVILK